MSVLARLFILVAIAVLPALAIEAYNQFDLRRERELEVREQALRLAAFASGELDRIVENGRGLLLALARLPAVRDRDATACSAYFSELKQLFPQYKAITATDAEGSPFCSSHPLLPGINFGDKPYWRLALQTGEFTVGVFNVGLLVNAPVLPLALAFRDASGAVGGVVYVSLDLNWLALKFSEKSFNADATIAITDRDGVFLLRLPDNERYVGTKLGEVYNRYLRAPQPGTDEIVGVDGVRRILGYMPIDDYPGLYVGIGLTRETAFAAIDRATQMGIGLITVGLLLALAAAWLGGRQFISIPIGKLVEAAGHWRRGEFLTRVAPIGGGEIALLGDAFNEMAAELEQRQQENTHLLNTLEERVHERTRELEHEIEERRRAEDALVQAQKMEAIGQLTGGIAHDFNNLLTAVIGNLELADRRLGMPEVDHAAVLRMLRNARRSAERGAALTQDLLAFARRQSLRVEPIDLNAVVRNADDLLRRTVGPLVRIDDRLAPRLWPALADPSQMELVLLNLVINARDAMPSGGTVTVETANLAAGDPHRPKDLAEGEYVEVSVSDTGTGMPADVLARCLDPFFTTKDIGKGSGLGLSVVLGVAKQSGGTIEIKSEVGHGTCVRVYLPRAIAADGIAGPGHEDARAAGDAPETLPLHVLLVDDDRDVREVVAAQLEAIGCTVTEAPSGRAALDLFDRHGARAFDVLVSDYAMPDISGIALARAVQQRRPGLPVILITGYNELAGTPSEDANWTWLAKPFYQADLARHLRDVLSRDVPLPAANPPDDTDRAGDRSLGLRADS